MQQCGKELKTEFWKATAAILKIQNKKNAKKNIEDTRNKNLKNGMIYFVDITETNDQINYFENN